MFGIAAKGLFGRRKDSLMLLTILFLSFLFSVLTSTFYTNSEAAKSIQRRKIYGQWQYAAYQVPEGADPFAGVEGISRLGKNRIIGRSPTFGTMASFDTAFLELASLELLQGRMPQAADEVALEQNQLSFFEETPQIGDELLADTEIFLFDHEVDKDPEEIRRMIQADASAHVLAGMQPALQTLLAEIYGEAWGSLGLKERLSRDLPDHISVTMGNRQRRRGLENFEDTLLLPNEESLLYTYELNLVSFLLAGDAESDNERAGRLDRLNDRILAAMLEPSAGESPLSVSGEAAFLFKQSYIVRRTLTLSGVYGSISSAWLGGSGAVPTALVTEATAHKFIDDGLMKTAVAQQKDFQVLANHFVSLEKGRAAGSFEGGAITANDLAFPPADSTDGLLALSVMVFIFLITLFGVFQLYTSQLVRRRRKLGLLRSVGATTRQIRHLLGWELLISLSLTLPLATAAGVGLAWLFSGGPAPQMAGYSFRIDPPILAISLISGLAAVVLGVLWPLRRIREIQLTGRSDTAAQKGRRKGKPMARQLLGARVRPLANLNAVLERHRRFARKQTVLTQFVYGIIFAALLLSFLLAFLSFARYRDDVVAVNMPDYDIRFAYALSAPDLKSFDEELTGTGMVAEAQHLLGRRQGQLTLAGGKADPLLGLTKALLPPSLTGELFITDQDAEKFSEYFTPGSRKVNVYGVEPDTVLFDSLDRASGGLLDSDAFKTGRSAVLLYPAHLVTQPSPKVLDPDDLVGVDQPGLAGELYRRSGAARTSFDFRSDRFLSRWDTTGIHQIQVTFNSEQNTEIERNILPPTVTDLELAAVISALPEFGVWPFSRSLEQPVIVGSHGLIRQLTESNRSIELLQATPPNQTLVPSLYGFQTTSVWMKEAAPAEAFLKIQQLAHRYGGSVQNLLVDKQARFSSALRVSMIVFIAALIITLTALQIQLNISKARIDAERVYIGTLQSLGVSRRKLQNAYLRTGLGYSLNAILAVHGLFAMVLLGYTLAQHPLTQVRRRMFDLIKAQLWLYPWLDHFLLTLAFLILGTLIYFLPIRRVLRIDPITNIRHR